MSGFKGESGGSYHRRAHGREPRGRLDDSMEPVLALPVKRLRRGMSGALLILDIPEEYIAVPASASECFAIRRIRHGKNPCAYVP